jgi:hypothetical protein
MAHATEHNPQADFVRGQMEVADQRSTYTLFNSMVHWCATFVAALVAFLTLWLCAHIAFIGSAVVALIIVGVGVWMGRNTGHNAGY